MQFNNLDDVEKFLEKNVPDWVIRRGTNTHITSSTKHADNYEVLQIFDPKDKSGNPFAEFWRGLYEFSPSDYNSLYGPAYGRNQNYFKCIGPLDYAISAILKASKN